VTQGPIVLAEIYDGEKYDARLEIGGWSRPGVNTTSNRWVSVDVRPSIPSTVDLSAGFAEPSRRIEILQPKERITTPSGKTILDLGQNLVGYVRIKHLKGPRGHKIMLRHAEVLENGELGVRPLRVCKAEDTYTLKGAEDESYEPRFTFHGFRYLQIEDWPSSDDNLLEIIEAVVCHTDMEPAGSFACSDESLNQLYSNATWSTRGNFLSVPTDCPQRDERLGWTGDLALFAPTATFLYKCTGILKGWLADLDFDQKQLGGVPPFVVPNVLQDDRVWGKVGPAAIWHDVTILAPWALWEATKDSDILERQYDSMITWLSKIPRNKTGATHLWDFNAFQLAVSLIFLNSCYSD
jgi:alpha-L-rhamnosidase